MGILTIGAITNPFQLVILLKRAEELVAAGWRYLALHLLLRRKSATTFKSVV